MSKYSPIIRKIILDLAWKYVNSPADAPKGRRVRQLPSGAYQYDTRADKGSSDEINPMEMNRGHFDSTPVTPDEKDAISQYKNISSFLNKYLHGSDQHKRANGLHDHYQNIVKHLDNLIGKCKLPYGLTLYSGASASLGDQLSSLSSGDTFTYKGYLSTTLKSSKYKKFSRSGSDSKKRSLVFTTSGEEHGFHFGKLDPEAEILMPRDLKFKIVDVESSKNELLYYVKPIIESKKEIQKSNVTINSIENVDEKSLIDEIHSAYAQITQGISDKTILKQMDEGKQVALGALDDLWLYRKTGYKLFAARDTTGRLKGLCLAYPDRGHIQIRNIGSIGERGKGVGSALMSEVKKWASEQNIPIHLRSEYVAQGFYEKQGFKREGSIYVWHPN